ncbi:cysteine-rich CWC family protein [Rhodoferax sp. WC2427]|uniref:cysteine-rich CWC family protein n=1 Tax=Rhodoferax sp. WC2427 TaxID=3234144 RepID=UPI0034668A1B
MPSAANLPNPQNCPLCGLPNLCAMEQARRTGQAQAPCWCLAANILPATLASIPPAARDLACICAACAAKVPTV